MCISDAKQLKASSVLKKAYNKSELQIANGNDKLDTILNLVNSPENLWQNISNTHSISSL